MTPRFDLIDMVQTAYRRRRFIILVTLAAAAVGAVGHLVGKKKYKATSEFIVANPMYSDRNHFYRVNTDRYVDYFAGEDDIDRVIAIAQSDAVKNEVVRRRGLFAKYKLDSTKRDDVFKLSQLWKKHLSVMRTEYKNMEISFTDEDPEVAAAVANETVNVVEEIYRGYYMNIRLMMHNAIMAKMREADSAIVQLTDSVAKLRERYQIYDIISPQRATITSANIKSNGRPDFGWGLEQVQNVESVKDQWVTDRTRFVALMNEFSTGTNPEQLSFIRVITEAVPPIKPAGLGLVLTAVACGFVGFFISLVSVLLFSWMRLLITVER